MRDAVYHAAGLTSAEINLMPTYLEGDVEFYDTSAYDKLYEYFAFELCEMPYEVAKCRTATPDEWILDYIEALA